LKLLSVWKRKFDETLLLGRRKGFDGYRFVQNRSSIAHVGKKLNAQSAPAEKRWPKELENELMQG